MTDINFSRHDHEEHREHKQSYELLPWWVNGTLSDEICLKVEAHVDSCTRCQLEVQRLNSLNSFIVSCAETSYGARVGATKADVKSDLASVMHRIDQNQRETSLLNPRRQTRRLADPGKFIRYIIDFVTPVSTFQWSATALAGVLMAVLVSQIAFSPTATSVENNYTVLSSADRQDLQMHLSVIFAASTTSEDARSIILRQSEILGQKVDVEQATDGRYLIAYRNDVSVVEINNLFINLMQDTAVLKVNIVP